MTRKTSPFAWAWLLLAGFYLLLPLIATLVFSLQADIRQGIPISFSAYANVIGSNDFASHLAFSFGAAVLTNIINTLPLVPTADLGRLKMPVLLPGPAVMKLRPVINSIA